jgi:hypothetical protein
MSTRFSALKRTNHEAHIAIVGGNEIGIENVPWQVVVFGEFEGRLAEFCGGSILDATHILTAGHCVYGPGGEPLEPSAFVVTAGTSSLQKGKESTTVESRFVEAVRVHPYFRYALGPGTPDDVAVLTLSSPLATGVAVQPISLAPAASSQAEGTSVSLTGFGFESSGGEFSGKLNSLTLGVRYRRECGGEADALFVCASAPGGTACFADEGGALTSTQSPATLVGVMDIIEDVSGNPCSDGALDGFVNVAAPEIRDFIEGSESPPQAPRGGGAVIEGVPEAGRELKCDPGTWSNDPVYTYVFENSAGGAVLQAGASSTYKLGSGDVGHSILCEVQASNAGGTGIGRTPGLGPIEAEPSSGSSSGSSSGGSSSSSSTAPAPAPALAVAAFTEHVSPAVPDAQLASTALTVSSEGVVEVKVSCPAGESGCAGEVTLRTLSAVSASAAKGRSAVLTLAAGSFTVAGGKVATVTLRLSSKARALLAREHVLRARAIVAAHDPAGATHTAQAIVTLRLAKPHGKR